MTPPGSQREGPRQKEEESRKGPTRRQGSGVQSQQEDNQIRKKQYWYGRNGGEGKKGPPVENVNARVLAQGKQSLVKERACSA